MDEFPSFQELNIQARALPIYNVPPHQSWFMWFFSMVQTFKFKTHCGISSVSTYFSEGSCPLNPVSECMFLLALQSVPVYTVRPWHPRMTLSMERRHHPPWLGSVTALWLNKTAASWHSASHPSPQRRWLICTSVGLWWIKPSSMQGKDVVFASLWTDVDIVTERPWKWQREWLYF